MCRTEGINLIYVKAEDLKVGMRLARPIYNKRGILLYGRNDKITRQGIESVKNFGLIVLYVLEPAEPLAPMSVEEMQSLYGLRAYAGNFGPQALREAVSYAHRWAYGRNPAFYDYEEIGGDCTNYASQCIYVGTGVMNYTPTFGWYYINSNDKSPSWTGVEFLRDFLVREERSAGPVAQETQDLSRARLGDVIQLRFSGDVFQHSPVVVQPNSDGDPAKILVAAHSADVDWRPLSTYDYQAYRVLHILGAFVP